MHECEIVEVFKRPDVHFRQGLKFLRRVYAVAIGVEALHRHGGVEPIERPGMANARDLLIGIEDDFRAHAHPDMGMGLRGRHTKESDGRAQTAQTTMDSQRLVLRLSQ